MPSGFLWVAIQVLKTEMEYCVRVEARSCLPEYKNPLKIIRSDMRKIRVQVCLLMLSVCFWAKDDEWYGEYSGWKKESRSEEGEVWVHGRTPAVSLHVRVALGSLVSQE